MTSAKTARRLKAAEPKRKGGPRPRARGPRRRKVPWHAKPLVRAGIGAAIGIGILFLPSLIETGSEIPGLPVVGGDLHSLAMDPAEPRLYVGGHEGVAVSTNGGGSWRQVETLDNADAMGWAFDGRRVLVGGHPGLFVSEDGGRTFEMRNEGLPATDVHALGAGGDLIYAASPGAGVFASIDGGRSWEMRTQEAGQSFMGRILVDPEDPERLIAPDVAGGAAESTDGGRTWRALGGVSGAMWVSWDPANTRHLVVSGMDQAAESADGGTTWQPLDIPAGASVVELSPEDPATLYSATHQGRQALVRSSTDGGSTWTSD